MHRLGIVVRAVGAILVAGAPSASAGPGTGSDNTGGTLDPLQRNTRVEVPVAESQSVVIGAR